MSVSARQCRPSGAPLVFLLVAFGMLWIPVGQHEFLFRHWMKVGTFMAPFLLLAASAFRGSTAPSAGDLRVLSLTMLAAYLLHQFEEHWIDLHGQEYAFQGSVNRMLLEATGVGGEPLSQAGIFVINTSLVWLVGWIAIWKSPHHVFPVLAMAAIIVVNAVAHIGLSIANGAYNPGLLTSIVAFAPIGSYVYRDVLCREVASLKEVLVSLAWGVLAHVLMVGGLVGSGVLGLFSERAYFGLLIIWSITPALIMRAPRNIAQAGAARATGESCPRESSFDRTTTK